MRDLGDVTKDLLAAFRESGYCTECWVNLAEEEHDDKCPERGRVVIAQGWVECPNCDGRVCMACVLRWMHDDCREYPCPDCAEGLVPSEAVVEAAAKAGFEQRHSNGKWNRLPGHARERWMAAHRAALVAARRAERTEG